MLLLGDQVMTRHHKHQSNSTDTLLVIAIWVAIFAVAIWFLAKLFIPLCVVLAIYLIYYIKNQVYQRSHWPLILLSAATIVSGFCFFKMLQNSSEPTVAAPVIEITIEHHGFLEDIDYTKQYTTDSDEPIRVEMSDNVYYAVSSSEKDNKDRIELHARASDGESTKEPITIRISGDKELESDNGYLALPNQRFSFGETKLVITASNSAGEVSKTIIVNKVSVAEQCAGYGGNFENLVSSMKSYCSSWQTYNNHSTNTSIVQSTSNSSSKANSSSSACAHYEAGRCWDDLENAAYGQGQYDKTYGSYGKSYYETENCDSTCQDILDDAYNEGYWGS